MTYCSVYCSNVWREKSEEMQKRMELDADMINDARQAAEVHRRVRKYMQSYIKQDMPMIHICETLENMVRKLICENGLSAGIAFPTGRVLT